MARVLVIGGDGLLGQYVCEEARRRNHQVTYTHRNPMASRLGGNSMVVDLRDRDALTTSVRQAAPEIVVNAAAMTDVDACEDHPEEARLVNALAPEALSQAAKAVGGRLIHVSSDYVFDGSAPATESTSPNPLGVYGRTKREGEELVLQNDSGNLVIRCSALFGWNRVSSKPNSVTRILEAIEGGKEVRLFRDQRVTPTYAKSAAQAMFDLVDAEMSGIFHVASRDCVSRYEMGQAVVEAFGIPGAKLVPITMASITLRAPRPLAPCLVVKKIEGTLKRPMPGFRACLEDMRQTR